MLMLWVNIFKLLSYNSPYRNSTLYDHIDGYNRLLSDFAYENLANRWKIFEIFKYTIDLIDFASKQIIDHAIYQATSIPIRIGNDYIDQSIIPFRWRASNIPNCIAFNHFTISNQPIPHVPLYVFHLPRKPSHSHHFAFACKRLAILFGKCCVYNNKLYEIQLYPREIPINTLRATIDLFKCVVTDFCAVLS